MAYKKWFPDESELGRAHGYGGDYVRFSKLVLPEVDRDSIGSAAVMFDVYRDEKAAKQELRLPFRQLRYSLPPEAVAGRPLVLDTTVMAQFVYENVRPFISELADAEDLL